MGESFSQIISQHSTFKLRMILLEQLKEHNLFYAAQIRSKNVDRVHGRQLSLFSNRTLPPAVLRGMYFIICREQIDISNVI